MKILFLTSGLEPGKDGVGDHVRMLGRELTRRGHEVRLAALNDRLCGNVVRESTELRLPESLPWPAREPLAKAFISEFRPDWISLHFVPFGFHPRGVPLGWGRRLAALTSNARTHIMFHELWLGIGSSASLKDKAIGLLQRRLVADLQRRLRPRFVTTSNTAYSALLKQIGIHNTIIQMFGNIPIDRESRECTELPRGADVLNVTMFGSLHPEWPPQPLINFLNRGAKLLNRKLALISIGNIGPGTSVWKDTVRENSEVQFVELGIRSSEDISACLNQSHFGIATSPLELIGKSGSAAAMLEHGLPVIVNRIEPQLRNVVNFEMEQDPQIIPISESLPEIIAQLPRWPKASRLPAAADRLLAAMASNS